MLTNHLYNLIRQLAEESTSLDRIRADYRNDSDDCAECVAFWEKMIADKESHVAELKGLVKEHL